MSATKPRSREVQFFMGPEDEREFVSFALAQGDTWFVRDMWYADHLFDLYHDTEEFFRQPVRDSRHQSPVWLLWRRDFHDRLDSRQVFGQPYFEIRRDVNPVVEFTRTTLDKEAWTIGRLAYFIERVEDGTLKALDPCWVRWAESLRKWILKRGVPATFCIERLAQRNLVFLPGAVDAFKAGAPFGWLDGKPGALRPLD